MELEMTWSRAVRVWWAFLWRIAVFSSVLELFAGLFLVAIKVRMHWSTDAFVLVTEVVVGLIYIAVSLMVTRVILTKDFGDFRLAAMASNRPPEVFEETPKESK
jgi:hypothetical protein